MRIFIQSRCVYRHIATIGVSRECVEDHRILTRFYPEQFRVAVATIGKCPHSYVVPCVWLERPIAVHRLVHSRRDILAQDVLADRVLDCSYFSIIDDVVR